MATPAPSAVHVGDVGSTYKAKIQDNDSPFNPSSAIVTRVTFKTGDGTIITRDQTSGVTVTTDSTDWYLEYEVTAADLAAGLHATSGAYSIQGFVQFVDGSKWYTNVEKYVVVRNIS